MKKLLVFIICACGIFSAYTQPTVSFRSSAEKILLSDHAEADFLFVPETAAPAKIFYRDGSTEERVLQYNILLDAMQYQDSKHEWMMLEKENDIDSVVFPEQTFIHIAGEGFLELRNDGPYPFFLKRRIGVHYEAIKKGAYGMDNRASNIQTYHRRPDGIFERNFSTRYHMTIENRGRQEMEVFLRQIRYFMIQKDGELLEISNRRTAQRAFPGQSQTIRRHIRQHNTDFSREQEVLSLLQALQDDE